MTDRSAHMMKEAEMLALRFEMAKLWDDENDPAFCAVDLLDAERNLVVKALRAAAPAPAAGVIDREAVAKIIEDCINLNEYFVQAVDCEKAANAILALKPTMAGEPVAWRYRRDDTWPWIITPAKPDHDGFEIEPLYASPAPSGRDPATIEAIRVAVELLQGKESELEYQRKLCELDGEKIYLAKATSQLNQVRANIATFRALVAPALVTEER